VSVWMLAIMSAVAQDVDAHGFVLAAYDADARDPIRVQRPGDFEGGSAFAGALFEYGRAPLVAIDPRNSERIPLIDNLFSLDISAGFAPHERVRIDVTAPLYGFTGVGFDRSTTSGFGVGDTRVTVMGVLLRGESTGGLGLALVPHVDIPTGVFDSYLGRNALAGGGVLAATWESGALTLTGNGGYQVQRSIDLGNLNSSDAILMGAAVGYMLDEELGLNAEVAGSLPTVSTGVGTTGSPFEVLGTLRYAGEEGAHFTAGGAAAITQGAGAAQFRVFVGGGFGASGGPRDADGDGFVDSEDACPAEPEVRNGYEDEDGCPDFRPTLSAWASFNGAPILGADLQVEGAVTRRITTTAEPFSLEVDPDSTWKGSASYGACLVGEKVVTVGDTNTDLVVELELEMYGEVELVVLDPEGDSFDQAVVEFSSAEPSCVPDKATRTDPDGRVTVGVGRGTHTIRVRSREKHAEVEFTAVEGKTLEVVVMLGL